MRLSHLFLVILALTVASPGQATDSASEARPLKTFGVTVELKAAGLQLREQAAIGNLAMPVYPEELLNAGIRGECEIFFDLKEDGSVDRVRVGRRSNPEFAESALTAVSSWRFPQWKWISKPRIVAMTATFTFTFSED